MDPLTMGLIAGGSSLLGSIFSSSQSGSNTQAQIQASQQQQATQNAFSEHMSSTAYQRASSDMKSAGLNPMMMFGSGGPASSPTGSGIQAPMPQTKSAFEGLGDATTKALSSAVAVKGMDKMADEMANLEAENARIKASAATERERPAEVRARVSNIEQDTTKNKLDRARQEWEAIKYLDLSGLPDAVRKTGNIGAWSGGKLSDTISPLISTAGAVRKFMPHRFDNW